MKTNENLWSSLTAYKNQMINCWWKNNENFIEHGMVKLFICLPRFADSLSAHFCSAHSLCIIASWWLVLAGHLKIVQHYRMEEMPDFWAATSIIGRVFKHSIHNDVTTTSLSVFDLSIADVKRTFKKFDCLPVVELLRSR